MRSMTGYGRAQLRASGVQVAAEVRTLNQRFFELKLNVPRGWGEYEAEMRRMVQRVVERGRVEVFIRYSALHPPPARLRVNDKLAHRYVAELRRLAKRLGTGEKISIGTILSRPEIFQVMEDQVESKMGAEVALRALARALKAVDAERGREGRSLKRDLCTRLARVAAAVRRLEQLAEQSRAALARNFHDRVHRLLGEAPIDEKRLYQDAADFAQRADVSEEMTRLHIHLSALGDLMRRKGPVGKSIEFLLQEINREVNTVGNKSQSAELSHLVVELKEESEKMREQVQNVE